MQSEVDSPFNPRPDPTRPSRVWAYLILGGSKERDVRRPKHDLARPPPRPLFRDMVSARAR